MIGTTDTLQQKLSASRKAQGFARSNRDMAQSRLMYDIWERKRAYHEREEHALRSALEPQSVHTIKPRKSWLQAAGCALAGGIAALILKAFL